jgi:hypothetical protein
VSPSASHFRIKLICPFYFFLIIAQVHKAAGVSRKATKTRQKRFLSTLLDYWISTAKFMFPLYGKERSPFFKPYVLQKERTQLKKEQGKVSLCLLAYGNKHSFHFFCPFICETAACIHSLDPAKICALCRHGFKS